MITAIKKTNNQASTEITRKSKRLHSLYVQLLQKSRRLDPFTLLQYLGTMSVTPSKHIRMKMAILIKLLSQHRVGTNMYFI